MAELISTASTTASTNPTPPICQHFLSGKCNRGQKCRFTHPDSIPDSKTSRKRPGSQFRSRQMEEREGREEKEVEGSIDCAEGTFYVQIEDDEE